MGFAAENFAKSNFEPVVDRDRGWAVMIGLPDREARMPIVLYSLDDLDRIGIRDDKKRLIEIPDQPEIALSSITAVWSTRAATDEEAKLNPDLEVVIEYTFHGSPKGRALSPFVPGCDWEQSKAVYGEALMAWESARKKIAKNPNRTLLTFK
ncbi:MAG: hypothetical protein Pars92KO_04060 [Parasphingorhabdus sp.]